MDNGQTVKKKNSAALVIIIILLFMLLILLFFLSPLKEMILPSQGEPDITLVVMESADSANTEGLYRILIEAVVEGNPEPQVQFNRNDGIAEVEQNYSLVLLEEGETFLLTAVAVNTNGSAQASLELTAGIAVGISSAGSAAFEGAGADEPDSEDEDTDDGEGAAGDDDDTGVEPAEGDENNAPEIEAVFYEEDNISDLVFRSEALPVRYVERRHNFVLVAADADGDALEFDVAASHGRIVDTTRIAVDSVAFTWLSPANPEGNLEALNVSVTVTARDPAGAADRQIIGVALLPVIGDGGGDEAADPGDLASERTVRIPADPALSGFVASDEEVRTGVVLVGDSFANKMYKGFLTFNLAEIRGVAAEDILVAMISFQHVNKSGRPESFATWLDLKEFDYGPTLDVRDFAVGGTLFYKFRAESFASGTVAQGSLITGIRQAINAGKTRFQVKMGLDAGTNSNDADDLFQFRPENVFLEITYQE
jgi:hypothetical protein